jgi:exonuclease VII large subunit
LAGRQVEHLYQTLRGVLNEANRQILTMEQQSWLGARDTLDNYEDRVAFAQTRIAELKQKLQEELQKK